MGLTAAHQLAMRGANVRLYERLGDVGLAVRTLPAACWRCFVNWKAPSL